MEPSHKSKKPIINAHAHIFTHEFVPPYLARRILPWPFYLLVHVGFIVKVAIALNKAKRRLTYSGAARRFRRRKSQFTIALRSNIFLQLGTFLVQLLLGTMAVLTLFSWCMKHFEESDFLLYELLIGAQAWFLDKNLIFPENCWVSVPFVTVMILFIPGVRKLIVFLFKKIGKLVKLMPSKQSISLIQRYLNLIQFALYRQQWRIASKLRGQYPIGTQFVVLPMDMEYMGAGKLKNPNAYIKQHDDLLNLSRKNPNLIPFVFVDPRRIREEGKSFLDFEHRNGHVELKDSVVKTYIEDKAFGGFKIYPALGYYPFDEDLLPLWKYAADNQIPIMSHGVVGVIYYRGKIEKAFREHPVFKENLGQGKYTQMGQYQRKHKDFQVNFTHPMNFLCLLEEPFLRILVSKSKKQITKDIFGYTNAETPLKYNLRNLKVCYAHFGGGEEWEKHYEQDRNTYSQQLRTKPRTGIEFVNKDRISWGRLEMLWKGTDWYSIICSMMMQYPNFYSDISYTISKPEYYPLIRQTLIKPSSVIDTGQARLRTRVLFGTDFYVVRSQMADKEIMAEIQGYLSEEEFDLIARENTHEYLNGERD